MLYTYWDAREFNLRQADIASKRALELEPDLAEAHVARGIAVSLTKKFDEAEKEFETAMRLDPKLYEAAYFYGRGLKSQGRNADALKMFERASLLRPEDFQAPYFLMAVLDDMGLKGESEAQRQRTLKLIEERLELNPDDARATNLGAGLMAKAGDRDRTIDYIRRSLAIDPEDSGMLYNIACSYSLISMPEEALSSLETALDNGFGHKEWLEHDSDLDSIRATPRFQALTQAM
jgi:tetratricopeptide (TPR) repeat protein